MNDNGYKPPIIAELESDAESPRRVLRRAEGSGHPGRRVRAEIIANLYKRIRYVTPGQHGANRVNEGCGRPHPAPERRKAPAGKPGPFA